MKKLLLIALVALGAWNYYQKQNTPQPYSQPAESVLPDYAEQVQAARNVSRQPNFQCDGRQHCSQMTSRAEAEFFLRNCPNTKMDGDRDGVPCENDSRF
tara:strand:+ start:456 stop:752 length:297 start_codon:yes stop_codon:yes gene_type:complete